MLEGDDRRRMTRAGVDLNGARERVSLPRCSRDCSEGLISRAGHLNERDAASTGLELFSRGAYVPLFLSPNPPILGCGGGATGNVSCVSCI